MWIGEALDEVEHCHAGLDLGLEGDPVEELTFKGGKEALAERVVVGIPDRAHRTPHPGLAATAPKGDGGVLAALVRVLDERGGTPLPERPVEGGEDPLGAPRGGHRPANPPPAEGVHHPGRVQKPAPGGDLGVSRPGHFSPGPSQNRT